MVNGHSDLAPDKDRLLKRLLALPFEYFRQHEKALRNLFSTAKTPNYDDMLKHYGTAIPGRQTSALPAARTGRTYMWDGGRQKFSRMTRFQPTSL